MSRLGGGLTPSIQQFAGELQRSGRCLVSVCALADRHSEDDLSLWAETGVTPATSKTYGPASFGYAPSLASLIESSRPDLLHRHGLWNYPSFAVRRVSARRRIPYVVSIHGMMNPGALSVSASRKRLFFRLFERKFLFQADCIHALSADERDVCRRAGSKNPIAIIPNGVPEPSAPPHEPPPWNPDGRKTLLYIGRIHPIKGLPSLLHGLKDAPRFRKDWRLVLAGWDQGGHIDELREIIRTAGLDESVQYIGPVYDEKKASALAHCDAFVLPSTSEAQPISVLEAWSYGKPTLITTMCNVSESADVGASIVVKPNAASLASGLERLSGFNEESRTKMGDAARRWASANYRWEVQGTRLLSLYHWILGRGERPDFVDTLS